ncbi:LytR/AlgR family response regulator transcription factor [Robertkochia solimangrovi]|uniref:LytR/AlgR family response regulator transcription factor n=1 Tax=Robertkochia solimangrovi TaxID=2213046 RepID=UPI00117F0A44|nr:response regulator transcription factor [Robertkochia solimangrovi]TRZ44442.1 DNA-binding response regulator [Robertkochia solimangrovi]
MKLKCIIVDDEPLAVNVIKKYVSELGKLELVETFNSAVACIKFLEENHVDIIFLDINMPLLDGLNFVQSLNPAERPMIILTTAHVEYAIKGYELDVLDYLVKPIPFHRFVMAVNKAFKLVDNKGLKEETSDKDFLFIKVDKKKLQKIYFSEISVIESLKDYIKIITDKGKFIVHQTLSSFTDELPSDKFLRIHRSYTISIDKVEMIEGNSLGINGMRYTIGRSYLNDVKKTILDTEINENFN